MSLGTLQGIWIHLQGKLFKISVIQAYDPSRNAEKAEVEWFYEDLQDLLELTPKKDVLFIIGDWNAKIGSQEIPGVTDKFGLGIQNEAWQKQSFVKRMYRFSKHPFPTTQEMTLHVEIIRQSIPKFY